MAMTLSNALAPMAKVQKNLEKFISQSIWKLDENNATLERAAENFQSVTERVNTENDQLAEEISTAREVVSNLSKLLGK